MMQPPIGFNFHAMDYKKESGRRLKTAREALGWTLETLSKHTEGMTVSRISNYEQGLRFMDPSTAKKLAKALNTSAAYLLCVDDHNESDEESKLIEKYRATDQRGKETILQVADAQPEYGKKRHKNQNDKHHE